MMQDRKQKGDALEYAVQNRWFPQLEVDLVPRVATSGSVKALTDVDVLACIPDSFEGFRMLIIDCKTRKKESPISRFFWLRGVMDHFKASRGMCLFLRSTIEPDHRYLAAQQNVTLLTEDEFALYRTLTSNSNGSMPKSNIANIDNWDSFFSLPKRYPKLQHTIQFSKCGFWMCKDEAEACRKTIGEVARARPEIDPSKREHMAIYFDLVALFAHALARLVSRLFAVYLQPTSRDQLSEALLMLLYGGSENYEHLNSLRKMIPAPVVNPDRGLTLPSWDAFLQLARNALDAPTQVSAVPLVLREISWSFLGSEDLSFAKKLSSENRQAAKFGLLCAEYLVKAAKLPTEFAVEAQRVLMELQEVPKGNTLLTQQST